jgi:ribosome-associated translation inhibitor RaiA
VKDESSVIRVEAESRETKKERDQVKVMVTVNLPHDQLRAESRRPKALDALDRCIEKLKPQVDKYKELHSSRWQKARVANRRRPS